MQTAMPVFAVVALMVGTAAGSAAQDAEPRNVDVGDLILGYVGAGTRMVTVGHLAYVDGSALLTPSLPSAMAPAIVDITPLPSAMAEGIRTRCGAARTTSGGCQARVSGQVRPSGERPGFVADHVELLSAAR